MNENNGRGFPQIASTTARFGQALLGSLFLISGLLKVIRYASVASLIAAKGIPMPQVVAALVIAIEIAGGAALVTGWRARQAALVLALFVIPATLLFHAFWTADAGALSNQLNHFLKNVAIFGALLMLAFTNGRAVTTDSAKSGDIVRIAERTDAA